MTGEAAADRIVHRITGSDRQTFLQGLITNDLRGLKSGLVYAALLTPQGKYLADFFLAPDRDAILLDVASALSAPLVQRLLMYRLRADVTIAPSGLSVSRGTGTPPDGAFADPRHPALGWRAYSADAGGTPATDWDAIRVAHCIPESGIELIPNDSYILECGFERLHGVDFRKGCYVGQEVTARMKHKTELRKGLVSVGIGGTVPVGTEVTRGGKPVGTVFTQSGGRAIAHLRLDQAGDGMIAGGSAVALQ
jgi:hypothetical protein